MLCNGFWPIGAAARARYPRLSVAPHGTLCLGALLQSSRDSDGDALHLPGRVVTECPTPGSSGGDSGTPHSRSVDLGEVVIQNPVMVVSQRGLLRETTSPAAARAPSM
jgi:hypothetical protein